MAYLTLTQMLASIPDGGANTAAEVRAIIEDLVKSKIWAPYSLDNAEDVFWQADLAGFTDVDLSGDHTATEGDGFLSVRFNGQTVDLMSGRLKARTFTIGDAFTVRLELQTYMEAYTQVGLAFTDGTVSGSNAAAAMIENTTSGPFIVGRHGTLGALSTVATPNAALPGNVVTVRLRYAASNSFFAGIGDGTSMFEGSSMAKTMTPTHFGLVWSKNSAATPAVVNFRPICKVA